MSIAQKTKTSYADIRDISLVDFLDVETERTLLAHELWKDQATIVIVIRRPGCQFCREEAQIFDAQRETIENDMGIKMVCIVHEREGADEFQKEFWHGKVYHDQAKDFYKALGNGRLRTGGWGQLIHPSFWGNLIRNKRSGVKGNFIGDGSILGGVLLVQQGDQGLAYEHIEKVWGDIARADRVLEAASRVSGVAINKEKVLKAQKDHRALHDKMQASSLAAGKGKAQDQGGSEGSACALPEQVEAQQQQQQQQGV
ncbi:hypothetical protein KI688_011177 [Linnemannia hyalina]|uniref:Peroxiredoxin-like 2A n=1 Tax=Linnemannia hyalina TaxID=64524 RepID=A0A9P8BV45_9FUNG|nr:hypothetical protein KI688_011177 [Linnemannia hyalina]